jgi:thiamine-monophosphate kinase
MTHVTLGAGPEFDRIRAIAGALGDAAGPLGDDCAVIEAGPGRIVLSTDVSVEGIHFRPEWLAPEEIGWRAAAAALSDLAAAGAGCVGLLAAVSVPAEAEDEQLVAVMRGVGSAVRSVGGQVLGGDLSRGPGWSLAITVIGRAERPLSRRGARAGDGVWVTGVLGGARAAVTLWREGKAPPPVARAAFAHPVPRLAAGRWLAAHDATAMIDLSDGLGSDAGHLAAASDVGVEVDLAALPVSPALRGGTGHEPAAVFAARGGEDYELLVTLPAVFGEAETDRFRRDCGIPLTCVGRVVVGTGARLLLDGQPIAARGFDHFA